MVPAFISKYKIIQKIGEGSFSEVLKCEDRSTKELYAAKILKKNFENNSEVLYCAEIIAMQKLSRHPNILYMNEYFFERHSGRLIFVFELMDMSMYEFMKSKKRCIPEIKVKNYLFQMLKGLDYLHRHGLFHRDVKPENVLVRIPAQNKSCYYMGELIKIADLGSIRGIYSKPPYTEYISTRWYRSPECLLSIGHYGLKMDIWATGCVFFEILTMKPLFPGNNEIDQLSKIHAILGTPTTRMLSKLKSRSKNMQNFPRQIGSGLGPLINSFSEDAQNILKLMLQYDPDLRSNARRILQHKYFSQLRDEERYQKYRKSSITREYGDSPEILSYSNINIKGRSNSHNKFQSNSLKSFFNAEAEKQSMSSNTTVELPPKKPLRINKPKKNIRMRSKESDPGSMHLHKHWQDIAHKYRLKAPQGKMSIFTNATSNLLRRISALEDAKEIKLQSPFVLHKKNLVRQNVMENKRSHM